MGADTLRVVSVGELVAAVFDTAEEYSSDSKEVLRMATETVFYMVGTRSKEICSLLLPSSGPKTRPMSTAR